VGGDEVRAAGEGTCRRARGERVAKELAARILAAVRDAPHVVGDLRLEMRVSIGIGLFRQGTTTSAQNLVHDAGRRGRVGEVGGQGHGPGATERCPGRGRCWSPTTRSTRPRRWASWAALLADECGDGGSTSRSWSSSSGAVVGYEALARGPEGSPAAPSGPAVRSGGRGGPERRAGLGRAGIAAVARRAGRRAGQRRVVVHQLRAGGGRPHRARPSTTSCGRARQRELALVVEITERATHRRGPRKLTRMIADQRATGHVIALDDVGADVRSLSLLSLIAPNVIKLDLRLVQDRPSTDQAAIVSAVRRRARAQRRADPRRGDRERRATRRSRARWARTLGQGWKFGRPRAAGGAAADRAREAKNCRRRRRRRRSRSPATPRSRSSTPCARPARRPKRVLLAHEPSLGAARAADRRGPPSSCPPSSTRATSRRRRCVATRRWPAARRWLAAFASRPAGRADPRRARRRVGSRRPAGRRVDRDRAGPPLRRRARRPRPSATPTGPTATRSFAFATVYDRDLVIAAARTTGRPGSRRASSPLAQTRPSQPQLRRP